MAMQAVRNFVWGPPPETKAEARLLRKIDFAVLSFVCLMYWSNYLDRANSSNAYVSGMQEALGMTGDDLNKVNTCFTVGYTIAQIPQNLLLQVIPARILFPLNMVIWGGLTAVTAAAKSTAHLEVIRFFQGMAEASTFVGAHYIMGSWYREAESCKRAAIFSASAQIATLFSGIMQASIHTSMDGVHGLAGFQWLFIICGLITIPIGIYGYVCFPDTPERNRSILFSAEDRALALARVPKRADTKLDRTVFRRVLGNWRWWFFSSIWIVGGESESIGSNASMALWMKNRVKAGAASWTVSNFNYYPNGATAVSVVALLSTAMYTDWNKKRYHVNLLIAAVMVVSASSISAQSQLGHGAMFFAFYIAGVSYAGQSSNFSWANDVTRHDEQERGIILASMNCLSNAFNAWWSIVFFPADHAPTWTSGMISILVLAPIIVILSVVARRSQLRDQRLAEEDGRSAETDACTTADADDLEHKEGDSLDLPWSND